MVTTGEYYELMDSANDADDQQWSGAPNGWINHIPHRHKKFFRLGGIGSGFQGAYYKRAGGNDMVLAIAGTEGLKHGSDLLADMKLAISLMPRQASSAEKLFRQAFPAGTNMADVTVVGQSLGGALAQAIGFWHGCKFLTFNAPGMGATLALSMTNPLKPQQLGRTWKAAGRKLLGRGDRGINLITWTDLIAYFGPHVGDTKRLWAGVHLVRSHGGPLLQNAIQNYTVNGQSLWNLDPFQAL
jgi:hypothetical protein